VIHIGYYEEIYKMRILIENLVKKNSTGVDAKTIIYEVLKRFKVSEKAVTKHILFLKEAGKIDHIDGILTWKG